MADSESRRRGSSKRSSSVTLPGTVSSPSLSSSSSPPPVPSAPCGACKFLRRKCVSGCIFAPYFGTDQGAARFAAVHKVFGASNVSKLLLHIPVNRRHDAVVTISYEAQARLSDPVYGCVSTILALQQQVGSLQAELSMVQGQLLNSRFTMANALQNSPHHHQQPQPHVGVMQPAYSNSSSVSTNFINMSNFASNFDLVAETAMSVPSSQSMDPLHDLSRPALDDEEDEEESQIPFMFTNEEIIRGRR
ncbi:LOB domain-containing protein 20-like [Pistacia vera]|uniref:LOB domain-containing protein 20-like n=1 Tax=Pistacia vera TaxID=55513 RepID=UPI001263B156|nr:LOB domain-containing protein 20-like [Pistacia vera]